jgi:hypothetical protein
MELLKEVNALGGKGTLPPTVTETPPQAEAAGEPDWSKMSIEEINAYAR